MTSKVKAIFDQIDVMLVQADQDAADLWHLLTALRGPDNLDNDLKKTTTKQLRGGLFPKTAAKMGGGGYGWHGAFYPAMSPAPSVVPIVEVIDTHFNRHFNEAVAAFRRQAAPTAPQEIPDGPEA